MSVLFPDLSNTVFPNQLDSIDLMEDIEERDLEYLQLFQHALLDKDYSTANIIFNRNTWENNLADVFDGDIIYKIYFANDIWVAVGHNGKIATALNPLEEWTLGNSGFEFSNIYDVYYANEIWVIVGSHGKIATASDPRAEWTLGISGFDSSTIRVVICHDSQWIIGG